MTVTGVDDDVDDGDVAYTIVTAAATSGDSNYSGVDAADVSVTNSDDDVSLASLGDRVFLDTNANGTQDAGEAGVAGVTVSLSGQWPDDRHHGHRCQRQLPLHRPHTRRLSGAVLRTDGLRLHRRQCRQRRHPRLRRRSPTGISQTVSLAAGETNLTVDAGLKVVGQTITGTRRRDILLRDSWE